MDGTIGEAANVTADPVAVGAGACAFAVVVALSMRRRPPDRARRLADASASPESALLPRLRELVVNIGAFVRRMARRPASATADLQAGAAVVLGLAGAIVHPVIGLMLAGLPTATRVVQARRARQQAAMQLIVELPDVVDLFRVAAGAGLTVQHAVGAVADVVDEPFVRVLDEVHRRVSLGERLAEALPVIGQLGEPVRPLVGALLSAERDGAALAGPLERASDHARDLRRRRAEEAARRIPVKLLFPLVGCVLPAFALLTVVPLLAGTLQGLSF